MRLCRGCGEAVWRVWGGILEGVEIVPRGGLEAVSRLWGCCLVGLQSFLKCVGRVCKSSLECVGKLSVGYGRLSDGCGEAF